MDPATRDLLLAQDGDDRAFTRFVEAVEGDVRRFCCWFTRPDHDLDDLVQETFLRAWRGLSTFSGHSLARAWLLTIARRACLDLAQRRQRDMDLSAQLLDTVRTSGDLGIDITSALLIEELPDEFREAFVLVKVLGFGYEEAAQVLDCPRGTIQSRVARARILLAASIENSSRAEAS